MKCDVTSEKDCKTVMEEIKNKFGRLDILHNNADIIIRKTVVELDEKERDLAVDVCLKGTYLLSKHAIPLFIKGLTVEISCKISDFFQIASPFLSH